MRRTTQPSSSLSNTRMKPIHDRLSSWIIDAEEEQDLDDQDSIVLMMERGTSWRGSRVTRDGPDRRNFSSCGSTHAE